jgi:hypothetical protein
MQLAHCETFRRTLRLLHTSRGQRLTRRDAGVIANAFGAVSRDDEMDLAPFASEAR